MCSTDLPSSVQISPGSVLKDTYRIDAELGSGGMGTVYRCFDPELDRPVALKVVSLGDLKQKEVRERFSREARALGRLRHPRIVTVHDFGEDADRGLLYLAMDLIEGRSLHDLQKGPERIGWRFIVAIAHQVADALEYAHRRGIVHRDVKPANIVIDEHDRATLVDFGIAKLEASSLTQAGMVLGTPSYLAPEMLSNQGSDYRADQFSLGTVLIEALAGRKIFAGDSFESVAAQIMIRETPSFAELGIDAPPTLEGIVRRLHQKDPSARYQDELELIDDLTIVGLDAGLDLHRAETHS